MLVYYAFAKQTLGGCVARARAERKEKQRLGIARERLFYFFFLFFVIDFIAFTSTARRICSVDKTVSYSQATMSCRFVVISRILSFLAYLRTSKGRPFNKTLQYATPINILYRVRTLQQDRTLLFFFLLTRITIHSLTFRMINDACLVWQYLHTVAMQLKLDFAVRVDFPTLYQLRWWNQTLLLYGT